MIGRLVGRIWPQGDALAATLLGVNCWWCAHPEPHDDNGCQRPGCPCTDLA